MTYEEGDADDEDDALTEAEIEQVRRALEVGHPVNEDDQSEPDDFA